MDALVGIPLGFVFEDGVIKVAFEGGLPLGVAQEAAADGGAEGEGFAGLMDVEGGVGQGLAGGVEEGQIGVAFAVAFDVGVGLGAPFAGGEGAAAGEEGGGGEK